MVETDVELAVMKLYFVVFYLAAGDTLPPLLPLEPGPAEAPYIFHKKLARPPYLRNHCALHSKKVKLINL